MGASIDTILSDWLAKLSSDRSLEDFGQAVIGFKIGQSSSDFYFMRFNPKPILERGVRTVDCEIETDSETLAQIFSGELNPQAAFITGRVRFSGDLSILPVFSRVFAL